MPESPTIGELFKAKAVTDEQVNAAVEAYLSDPQAGVHRWASEVIASPDATPALRQAATRTAILLARTQKA